MIGKVIVPRSSAMKYQLPTTQSSITSSEGSLSRQEGTITRPARVMPATNTIQVRDPRANSHIVDTTSKIQVVVRIRPMTPREISRSCRKIVESAGVDERGSALRLWDPVSLEMVTKMMALGTRSKEISDLDPHFWYRLFAFDKCLWSDSDMTDEVRGLGATQDAVFDAVGQSVVDWILDGYNCSVMAYGQTGSGKSYTMLGDIDGEASEFGLIPRICFNLFEQLDANNGAVQGHSDEVYFSQVEIYNENIRDLLAEPRLGAGASRLKVRENAAVGVFIAGLTTVRVETFEEVMNLISLGSKNRTVAATNSNAHSSRSHAIVTLHIHQRSRQQPRHSLPTSGYQSRISCLQSDE